MAKPVLRTLICNLDPQLLIIIVMVMLAQKLWEIFYWFKGHFAEGGEGGGPGIDLDFGLLSLLDGGQLQLLMGVQEEGSVELRQGNLNPNSKTT